MLYYGIRYTQLRTVAEVMTQFLIRCFIKHPGYRLPSCPAPPTATSASVWAWPATCFCASQARPPEALFGSIAIGQSAEQPFEHSPQPGQPRGVPAWRPKPRDKNTPTAMHRYELPGRTGGQCHHSGHWVSLLKESGLCSSTGRMPWYSAGYRWGCWLLPSP